MRKMPDRKEKRQNDDNVFLEYIGLSKTSIPDTRRPGSTVTKNASIVT